MKIGTLIKKADKCKTDEDAKVLLDTLERVFGSQKPLSHLPAANAEAFMEDDGPFVHFELNHVISNDYITSIRPEIRDGVVVVSVETHRMLDRLGMASQKWETVEDMDDLIEPYPDQTVNEVARQAADLAIANHRLLIEQVGVPMKVAKIAARKSW